MLKLLVSVLLLSCEALLGQTALNLSQDLVRLGVASSNMIPNQQNQNAGPLFVKAVQYAQSHQIARVIADRGAYYFLDAQSSPCYVYLTQLNNVTIDLQGSDLYFADLSASGFCAQGANITLQNFTIDYLKLPFTQVVVTSVNAAQGQIQFSAMPGWQKPSALNALLSSGQVVAYVIIFRNGRPWLFSSQMPVQQPLADDHVTFLDTGASTVAQVRPGDTAVVYAPKYSYSLLLGWFNVPCEACTLRNIRIYSGGKQPVYVVGESTLIERVYVMPKPGTDRLIGTNGVGVQLEVTGKGVTVRLSRAIRPLDEGFATHVPVWGTVQKVLSTRSVQGQPWVQAGETLGARPVPNGTPVEFQRKSGGAILASATLVSQSVAPPIDGQPQVILNFDHDLPGDLAGSFVYPTDPDQRGANTVVERNAFEAMFWVGTGIDTYGLRNSTVRGNYARRSGRLGIFINGSTFYDSETPPPENVTVSRNVIDGANSPVGGANATLDMLESRIALGSIEASGIDSDIMRLTASPLRNITIANNFIADPRQSAVWMGSVTGGSVSGNYFFIPNQDSSLSLDATGASLQPLMVDTSQNVTATNNTIDQTSGRIWVTDTQYRELAAYAPGSTIRLNAYGIGGQTNPVVSVADADGNSFVLTIVNTGDHFVDARLPDTAALGGAYVVLQTDDGIFLGTLFLDSQDNIPSVNGCAYEVSPSVSSAPADASTLDFLVVTQEGCSYNVLTNDTFVSPGDSSTGTAVISVDLAANMGPPRKATIEIAGWPITLAQDGMVSTEAPSAAAQVQTSE